MKTKILVLLTLLMAAPMAFAGLGGPSPIPNPPNFYINSSAVSLCRGTINYVPLTVTNGGGVSIIGQQTTQGPTMQNVELSWINAKSSFSIKNSTTSAQSIAPQNSITVYLPLFVAANASSVLSATVGINYYFYSVYSDSEVRNLTFGTATCGTPVSVAISPKVLSSGGINNVSVVIANNGAMPVNGITIRASIPGTDGTWLSAQPIDVSSMAPNSTTEINASIYVDSGASLSFPINISANFFQNGNLGQIAQSDVMLSSGIISLTPTSYTISPQTPSPDSIFSISFVLTNIGTTGATAVTATALPPEGFAPFGPSSVFVGDVGTDSQTPVTLTLSASNSVKPGSYQIPIRINYLNGIRQNLSTMAYANVYMSTAAAANFTANGFGPRAAAGGGILLLITLVLLIAVVVLAYLLYKEKRRKR